MMPLLSLASLALAIPRETVLNNAALYAAHAWTSTAANQIADCASGDYESDYPPGDYVGLPYDWGGYMSLDTFDQQLADGYGAGSHSWHGVLECTAGVDCSGFVSMIWETDHYSTSTFADGPTHAISYDKLERGDAVNDAGSHVVLFTHESDAGWPVFYEASGGAKKVHLNASSGWSYLDGYEPIRFDDIEEGPSTGTSGAPREITSFPYSDFRWTAGAASDAIDTYDCAPDTDESGPEVLYHFVAETQGRLTAVVSDDEATDIDVHVLSSPTGADCIARDDISVDVEVGPGDVWLSLDTFVASHEFPGAFILTADFEAGGEVDSGADDTDGGDDSGTGGGNGRHGPGNGRTQRINGGDDAGCGCASADATITAGPIPGVWGVLAMLAAIRRRRGARPGTRA